MKRKLLNGFLIIVMIILIISIVVKLANLF
ncbi:hypothetical protein IGJ76_001936 [Enterococcus sp. DIV0175]